ncbi:hypothetical protein MPTK1_4g12010 [Marchantia polymorpha subsp. ruderalis]|uniref:Uncharacterized protein n=2 Tax=Marchantia polymorpha TaxID=3197 RepID=A0AAF6B906_MARPO|nr:hypothetical protein MARPO_0294s0001 [Marchantia polymorpha]BBN08490.1 hypothetical protein Mp_4g12010 [Marchantia polymorpha subsp. ruderalis]|eukprot:PTQ26870.1 hypothetical protein MARPO_0294s0001 [Marchantia polymorpha]
MCKAMCKSSALILQQDSVDTSFCSLSNHTSGCASPPLFRPEMHGVHTLQAMSWHESEFETSYSLWSQNEEAHVRYREGWARYGGRQLLPQERVGCLRRTPEGVNYGQFMHGLNTEKCS